MFVQWTSLVSIATNLKLKLCCCFLRVAESLKWKKSAQKEKKFMTWKCSQYATKFFFFPFSLDFFLLKLFYTCAWLKIYLLASAIWTLEIEKLQSRFLLINNLLVSKWWKIVELWWNERVTHRCVLELTHLMLSFAVKRWLDRGRCLSRKLFIDGYGGFVEPFEFHRPARSYRQHVKLLRPAHV